ncbi:MAG: OsmC family protein [Desulfuromonadales bacterium]
MIGTFAGALEARQVPVGRGDLSAEVRGDIVVEDKVLVIRRIHVTYALRAADSLRETIERVHQMHHNVCPVYRSLSGSIEITTEYLLNQNEL